jgi:hypothetical protein
MVQIDPGHWLGEVVAVAVELIEGLDDGLIELW